MHDTLIPIHEPPAPQDEATKVLAMPRATARFERPRRPEPEPGPAADPAGAHALLQHFAQAMQRWLAEGGDAPSIDLAGLRPETLKLVNELLGEGEVAAIVDAGDGMRVQETVFCGVWRQQHFDRGGALRHDLLLAAALPPLLQTLAQQGSSPRLRPLPLPAGTMNVQALVHELQHAMSGCGPGVPPHVINLGLLPLSPPDRAHLDALLDGGKVVILARGFGHCRVGSTAARHVWRVQHFNSRHTLILDTLEVSTMPALAMAAPEDLHDSTRRLFELLQWMRESLQAA